MQESGWFDQLTGLKLIVPVTDIADIPTDFSQRLPSSKLHLLLSEQQCLNAEHQTRCVCVAKALTWINVCQMRMLNGMARRICVTHTEVCPAVPECGSVVCIAERISPAIFRIPLSFF
jgi:hypothetical protein